MKPDNIICNSFLDIFAVNRNTLEQHRDASKKKEYRQSKNAQSTIAIARISDAASGLQSRTGRQIKTYCREHLPRTG
jgi:hypothetical protein